MKRKTTLSTPTRELAQRLSGTAEVLLLWHPETHEVELSVRDLATGASFHLDVRPSNAMEAFYHPYAYAARSKNSASEDDPHVGSDPTDVV